MTLDEAIDIVKKTKGMDYTNLCDVSNPNHLIWRQRVMAKAGSAGPTRPIIHTNPQGPRMAPPTPTPKKIGDCGCNKKSAQIVITPEERQKLEENRREAIRKAMSK